MISIRHGQESPPVSYMPIHQQPSLNFHRENGNEGELKESATTEESSVVQTKGKRQVRCSLILYNLDALQAEVDKLKKFQAETSTELDTILPSILDKAFKGEL